MNIRFLANKNFFAITATPHHLISSIIASDIEHVTAFLSAGAATKQTRDLMQVDGLTNDEVKSIPQHGGRGPANSLEETYCSMKLHENIDDAAKADLYSLHTKHYTHLNNFKFPVLQLLQLDTDRGVLKSVRYTRHIVQIEIDCLSEQLF
nr:edestin 1 [Tanacetum cinerariifolium]